MAIYKSDIVNINLESGNIFRSFLNNSIGHKDDDADRFGIRAFRDGEPVDLSGLSCQAVFMAPNGVNIALTSYGTVSGNEAYVTLPPACYDYEGQFCLAIKLVGGGVTSTVRIVDGVVERTGTSGAVAPTSAVPTYQEILSVYEDMVAATAAANLAIAEEFDATKAYPSGKFLINDGNLYRLTADHAAGTTWANTSKVSTNFGDELSSLKSATDNTIDDVTFQYGYKPHITTDEFTYGKSLNNGVINTNARACSTLDAFKTIHIKTVQWTGATNPNNQYYIYIHYYSDEAGNTYLDKENISNKNVFTVPEGAKSARLCFLYYSSSSSISEITPSDFVPYFGIAFVSDEEAKISEIETDITTIENINVKNVSKDFDATKQYYIGDIVKYQNELYIFWHEHLGTWDAGNVKKIPLTNYTTGVRGELENSDKLTHDNIIAFNAGDLINGSRAMGDTYTPNYNAKRCTLKNPIFLNAGDIIYLDGDFTSGVRGQIVSDSIVHYTSGYKTAAFKFVVEAPGVYFINYMKVSGNEEQDITPDDVTLTLTIEKLSGDSTMIALNDALSSDVDGNDLIFVHVTDSHVGNAKMPSSRAVDHFNKLMALAKCVKADFVMHTGDMIQGFDVATTGSEAIDREGYDSYFSAIEEYPTPFNWCQGNPWHDFGHRITEGSNAEFTLDRNIVLNYAGRYGKWCEKHYNDADTVRSYYYFDMTLPKARIIVLDSDDYTQGDVIRMINGFSTAQITWFEGVLADARTKGYPVIVFTHMAPLSELHTGGSGIENKGGAEIAQAMEDHITNGGTLIECVCGHGHFDMIKNIDGVNYVFLACDFPSVVSSYPDGATAPSRTVGTLSEYCFDVHLVNAQTGTVKIYRYGAGNTTPVFPTRQVPVVT